jgi:hypothetical protein
VCDHIPVTADLIDLARAGDGEAFRQLVAPYERELQVHCYRMLGSVQDAEDALLAAWQGLGGASVSAHDVWLVIAGAGREIPGVPWRGWPGRGLVCRPADIAIRTPAAEKPAPTQSAALKPSAKR